MVPLKIDTFSLPQSCPRIEKYLSCYVLCMSGFLNFKFTLKVTHDLTGVNNNEI